MSKLTRVKLKDNFIDNLQDIDARLRRVERRPTAPVNPLTNPTDEEATKYWFSIYTSGGEKFLVLAGVAAADDDSLLLSASDTEAPEA